MAERTSRGSGAGRGPSRNGKEFLQVVEKVRATDEPKAKSPQELKEEEAALAGAMIAAAMKRRAQEIALYKPTGSPMEPIPEENLHPDSPLTPLSHSRSAPSKLFLRNESPPLERFVGADPSEVLTLGSPPKSRQRAANESPDKEQITIKTTEAFPKERYMQSPPRPEDPLDSPRLSMTAAQAYKSRPTSSRGASPPSSARESWETASMASVAPITPSDGGSVGFKSPPLGGKVFESPARHIVGLKDKEELSTEVVTKAEVEKWLQETQGVLPILEDTPPLRPGGASPEPIRREKVSLKKRLKGVLGIPSPKPEEESSAKRQKEEPLGMTADVYLATLGASPSTPGPPLVNPSPPMDTPTDFAPPLSPLMTGARSIETVVTSTENVIPGMSYSSSPMSQSSNLGPREASAPLGSRPTGEAYEPALAREREWVSQGTMLLRQTLKEGNLRDSKSQARGPSPRRSSRGSSAPVQEEVIADVIEGPGGEVIAPQETTVYETPLPIPPSSESLPTQGNVARLRDVLQRSLSTPRRAFADVAQPADVASPGVTPGGIPRLAVMTPEGAALVQALAPDRNPEVDPRFALDSRLPIDPRPEPRRLSSLGSQEPVCLSPADVIRPATSEAVKEVISQEGGDSQVEAASKA